MKPPAFCPPSFSSGREEHQSTGSAGTRLGRTQGVSKHCINAPGYQAAIGLPSATRLDSKFPRLGAALLPSGHRFTVRDPSGLEVSPARCRLGFAIDMGLWYLAQWLYRWAQLDVWGRLTAVLAVLLPQFALHLFEAIMPHPRKRSSLLRTAGLLAIPMFLLAVTPLHERRWARAAIFLYVFGLVAAGLGSMAIRASDARSFKALHQRTRLPSGHRFTVRDPSGLEVSPARCRLVTKRPSVYRPRPVWTRSFPG